MLDLTLPGSLKLLSETIHKDIDDHCVKVNATGHRSHLGASQIGISCMRELWYAWRWVYYPVFDGRQYRLFQRGHFEEPRFTEYFEGIGCEVTVFDKVLLYQENADNYFYGNINECEEDDGNVQEVEDIPSHEAEAKKRGIYLDKGKRQIRIYGCENHFAGSVDSIIKLPEHYGITQNVLFLGEYKTQGTQKFAKLQDNGCKVDKYQHFCQQSVYGVKLNLQYGVYISVNKNNDDLHIEVIELDWILGKELENKAEQIIRSQVPPKKISASANFFECKWCDYSDVCWFGAEAEKNCRSCMRAVPVENAQWKCNWYDAIIPKEFIRQSCGEWVSIL